MLSKNTRNLLSLFKKTFIVLGLIIVALLALVIWFFWDDANSEKYDITIDEEKIPLFEQVALEFDHQYNGKKSLPIAPAALIDINNDNCLLYTSPSPRDQRGSRMPSSA